MGFDKNDSRPIQVTTEKSTTKVNIGVIAGVLVFLILGVFAVIWVWKHPRENAQGERQKIEEKKQP